MVEVADGALPYALHHLVEHIEARVAVSDDRILLAYGLQGYSLAQLIHGVDMIHPVLIYCPEQHYALKLPHVCLHAKLGRGLHKAVFLDPVRLMGKVLYCGLKLLCIGDPGYIPAAVHCGYVKYLRAEALHIPFGAGV